MAHPQPLTAGSADPSLTKAAQTTRVLDWAAPLGALVLLVLIFFMSGSARYIILATVGYMGAVLAAIYAGLVWLAPSFVTAIIGDSMAKPLAPGLTAYVKAVAGDMSMQLLIGAGLLLAAAIVLTVVHGIAAVKAKFTKPGQSVPKKPSAKPDTKQPA